MERAVVEDLRDRLAVVICNAELALAMDGTPARERVEQLLASAWAAAGLLAGITPPAGEVAHEAALARVA
jgi:hypothetical protein